MVSRLLGVTYQAGHVILQYRQEKYADDFKIHESTEGLHETKALNNEINLKYKITLIVPGERHLPHTNLQSSQHSNTTKC